MVNKIPKLITSSPPEMVPYTYSFCFKRNKLTTINLPAQSDQFEILIGAAAPESHLL